jgi:hypothetical protein
MLALHSAQLYCNCVITVSVLWGRGQTLNRALFGAEQVERLVDNLCGLYEYSYCDVKTEKAQEFLFDYVHVREKGGRTKLATLSTMFDKVMTGDEEELLTLIKSVGKGTADKLVRSIRDLLGLLEYPCSRGNADLSADLLYPFIEPLLVKNWHEITPEDMFPVLEMLHSGM